jgi:predicted nucleotidyltransferase
LLSTAQAPSFFSGLAIFSPSFRASILHQLTGQAFAGGQVGEHASGSFYRCSPSFSGLFGVRRLRHIRSVPTVTGGDYDSFMNSMTDEALIEEAGRRLGEAAPGARVILFGSRARGEAGPDSDLDLLVIEPEEIAKRRAETARLKRELRGLEVALDVIVVSAKHVEEWGHFDGTMLKEALSEGRVLVDA